MVKSIRNIEKAISGNGIKEDSKSEFKNIDVARKSLHISK
jgi:N-acetylneuraminate synthase/N,N'-diacetyllegionaminate synthase